MKDYLNRFKNPGTLFAVICLAGILCMLFGADVDFGWLENVAFIFCLFGISTGVLNNPGTEGIDFPDFKEILDKFQNRRKPKG